MMNSKGLFAYYPATNVNFTVTVRSEDGTGSGFAASDCSACASRTAGSTKRSSGAAETAHALGPPSGRASRTRRWTKTSEL